MQIDVTFPGGLEVDAKLRGFTIRTDQSPHAGGTGAAPAPFDLFLASLATCAGYFALRFCRMREIDTEGLALVVETVKDEQRGLVTEVRLRLTLPCGFPEKYRDAIVRAIDQCTVKRHLAEPPHFAVAVETAAPALVEA